MTPLEAAGLGDTIGHTNAMKGLLVGLAVGAVIATVAVAATAATVATGGAAAVLIGGVIAGTAGAGLTGMNIGETFESEAGKINTGSPNTFLGANQKPAARAMIDTVACDNDGIKLIAQGSKNVFINSAPAVRKTDKTECSGKIRDGQVDVFFGGPTEDYLPMESEVPGWLVTTLHVAVWVGTAIATGGSIATVGLAATIFSTGMSMVGGMIGTKVVGDLGEKIAGKQGRAIGEAIGEAIGSARGGKLAGRIMPGKAPAPAGEIPVAARAPVGAKGTPGAGEIPLAARATPAAPKATPDAPKATPAAPKEAVAAPKATPDAPKATPDAPKATPDAPNEAAAAPKATPNAPKDAPPVRPDTSTAKYGPWEKYQKPDGDWNWPPKGGFAGTPKPETLPVGTRIDRFGHEGGTYLSPEGTPFPERALAPKSVNDDYHVYKVVKPLDVEAGGIAPAFDQPGGGVQYKTSKKVAELLKEGYIVEIFP
ncbi:MAG TPA: glycohydrolase toxin TNT-related protein [Polyangiaceae bacterium]|nr:glycohydrolase toxin TNT-related protein [Polyangiaceae bacterium]